MSILVELPENQYSTSAFVKFDPSAGFAIGTARAMAWMSQLAYETRLRRGRHGCPHIRKRAGQRIGAPIRRCSAYCALLIRRFSIASAEMRIPRGRPETATKPATALM